MTIAERIQLHKLGYSKDEINELSKAGYDPAGLEQPPVEPEQPEIVPRETPVEPEQPEIVPRETPVEPEPPAPVEPAQPDNAQLLAAINSLTAALQASNIRTASQPESAPSLNEQVDSILSQLSIK